VIATPTTAPYTLSPDGKVTVTVTERGAGRPVLLLHGGAGPQSMSAFADRLADALHARVITPTHPGFAGTPRPDALDSIAGLAALYIALLEDLDLVDVTVLGNSVGGWIAAEMALTGSARIARMVLLDAVGIDVTGHPVAPVSSMTLPEILQLTFHNAAPFVPDPAMLPPGATDIAAANMTALRAYSGPNGTDTGLLARLDGVAVSTLVLWGEHDRIADAKIGRAWADAIPNATFRALPGTGHLPHVETPEQVATAIGDFLATCPAWEHDYTANTTATPDNVWAALRDLYTGIPISDTADNIVIHGPFAAATRLTVTPQGADFAVDCVITELDDGKTYAYRSRFNGLYLTSRHTLTPLPGGGTQINHHSQIAGPAAETIGPYLGLRITEDRADTMHDLTTAAMRR
jgi:pimeloyl-ACP methyl ester carboxylesterase